MSDPTAPAPDTQPVKAFDRQGNKIELPASDVPELVKLGGRVATPQELAEHKAEADYAQKSTVEKVTGPLRYASPAVFAASLMATGEAPALHPSVESYTQGVGDTFGAGLPQLAVKEATRLAGGNQAAAAYADRAQTAVTANPTANTLGQAAGFVGGMVAGGSSAGGLASKVGASVEGAVSGALSREGAGALARAGATAAGFAARGAAESAMLAGTTYAAKEAFQDHEIQGSKLFAAMGESALFGGAIGGGLGFSGSLLASGVRAGVGKASQALEGAQSKLAARVADAAGEAEGGAFKLSPGKADGALRKTANNLAVDALGATQAQQNKVLERLGASGREDLGQWLTKNVPALAKQEGESVADAAMRAFKGGRADELLEQITPVKQAAGAKIGEILRKNPATVEASELLGKANAIYDEMVADPVRAAGAKAFSGRVFDTFKALEEKAAREGVPFGKLDAADTYYMRSQLEKQAIELGNKGMPAHDAWKQWLRGVDESVVSKVDEAASAAGNKGALAEIKAAKRDFQLAISAEKLADQGTKRVLGNNVFGIREGIGAMVGLATGSALGGVVAGVGGKLARERGAAVGAALLNAAVDRGMVTKAVEMIDRTVTSAAKNVLNEAPREAARATPYRTPTPTRTARSEPIKAQDVRIQAREVVKRVGEMQADPQAAIQRMQRTSEEVSRVAGPRSAAGFTSTAMKALTFVASHIPAKERRDPLDPRSVPPLTTEEADRVVRAAKYAARPASVWEDFERGRVTPEGIAAAETFMPQQLADFRQQLLSDVTERMSRDQRLTATQRLRIDKLLGGVPAGPDLRPENLAKLQSNFAPVSPEPAPTASPAPTSGKKVAMTVQQTGFDAVEARKAG